MLERVAISREEDITTAVVVERLTPRAPWPARFRCVMYP